MTSPFPLSLGSLGCDVRGTFDSWAAFSPCEKYRYALGRRWSKGPTWLWLLHNPSTADEGDLDPTMRRVRDFSVREGAGAMIVCNVMAWRATDKRALFDVANPVGPANSTVIDACAAAAARIVVAWGCVDRRLGVEGLSLNADKTVWCLGRTKSGAPKHPLYLASGTPFVETER